MHHKTTPYGLLSQFMSDVAPYLVSRIYTQPNLLAEACRFLCQTTTDFLSTTLSSTLPVLFASCDARTLEQISKEVSRKTSHLFLSHSASILAYIFLLPDHDQSTQALNFIVQVLIDAAESNNIDIQSIVKSCVVPLLTELIVVLGHENPARIELVSALRSLYTWLMTES
jgi:serine/threonine-protein kinase ATR